MLKLCTAAIKNCCTKILMKWQLIKKDCDLKQLFPKGALSGQRQFSAVESPLKLMKNAFLFTSKALFVRTIFKFRYLNFCLEFPVMQQNSLIRKIRLISNFMTSLYGQETIVMHNTHFPIFLQLRLSLVRMSDSRFLKRRYVENQFHPLVLFLVSKITAEAL